MLNFLSIEETGIFNKNEFSTVTSHNRCMLHWKKYDFIGYSICNINLHIIIPSP